MLRFLFSPMGRISRKSYLMFAIPVFLMGIGAGYADEYFYADAVAERGTGPIGAITGLLFFWPSIAVTSKRFHDRNMSGWWQVAFYVAIAVGFFVIGWAIGMAGGDVEFITGQELPTLLAGIAIVLAAAGVQFVILALLPGLKARNEHGENPLSATKDVAEVFS